MCVSLPSGPKILLDFWVIFAFHDWLSRTATGNDGRLSCWEQIQALSFQRPKIDSKGTYRRTEIRENALSLAVAARKTGAAGRLRKAKTPAETLAIRVRGAILPTAYYTLRPRVCQGKAARQSMMSALSLMADRTLRGAVFARNPKAQVQKADPSELRANLNDR